jgi:alanine dehydrogenase
MQTTLIITAKTIKSENNSEDMTVNAILNGDRIDIAIAIAQCMKDNQEFKQIIDVAIDIFNNHING